MVLDFLVGFLIAVLLCVGAGGAGILIGKDMERAHYAASCRPAKGHHYLCSEARP